MSERLDAALVNRSLCSGRDKAKELISNGNVTVNGIAVNKASYKVEDSDILEILKDIPYVSRGGLKLEKALKCFSIELRDLTCADIGASTGGFTDCMLQNGAKKVYAIDTGHDQLHSKLISDSRVINLENCNFRYITEKEINEPISFMSVDVSFISLKLILNKANELLIDNGKIVCLIKPQFEAGPNNLNKNGVVTDPKVHISVIKDIIETSISNNFSVIGLDYSPIKGPKGNIEYLILLHKDSINVIPKEINVDEVVKIAHNNLM